MVTNPRHWTGARVPGQIDRAMATPSPAPSAAQSHALSVRQWTGLGFLYWLVFMAALEPGNVVSALDAGFHPHWGLEATRLVSAALLGSGVTPLLVLATRRFPIAGSAPWRGLAAQTVTILILAPVLILISCFLAAWIFERQGAPRLAEVRGQMAANLLLLIFCQALFLAAVQVTGRLRERATIAPTPAPDWPDRLTIGENGRLTVLDLSAVEWIETQGNYQALHAEGRTHLSRETSARLLARLDPARFARIHRRTIVAIAYIREVEPLSNGDGLVRLAGGTELRMSRGHREALRARLAPVS